MTANKMVVAVKGIIKHDGLTLVLKRSKQDDVAAGTWELPGGKIDFGEDPEEALRREVREEAGISITVERIAYASSFLSDPSRQVIIIAYHCVTNHNDIVLSCEHTDYLWANQEQLLKVLPASILEDLKKNQCL